MTKRKSRSKPKRKRTSTPDRFAFGKVRVIKRNGKRVNETREGR